MNMLNAAVRVDNRLVTRREIIKDQAEEIKRLRAALGLQGKQTLESWGMVASQELRDQMAAQALVAEYLHPTNALKRLGFEVKVDAQGHITEETKATCYEVFSTDGVKEILAQDFNDAYRYKDEVIGRLHKTARFGDNDQSVRAAALLADLVGWKSSKQTEKFPGNVVNIFQLVNGNQEPKPREFRDVAEPDAIIDGDAFLDHVPGEAALVLDEAAKR